jgi:small subunit ribosomal protein S18
MNSKLTHSQQNFSIMSEYLTPMGRIKPATETGLRKVNQRKMAKAIRRSIGLGLMPSVHRHPEILYKENARARETLGRWTGSSVSNLNPGV